MTTITIKADDMSAASVLVESVSSFGKKTWVIEYGSQMTIPLGEYGEVISINNWVGQIVRDVQKGKPKPIDVGWHLPPGAE